jgi:hypothetical protein
MKATLRIWSSAMAVRQRTLDAWIFARPLAALLLCSLVLTHDVAAAQPSTGGPSPAAESARQKHDAAVGNCMKLWDSATHMTKQQWRRTCHRVQDRLRQLSLP